MPKGSYYAGRLDLTRVPLIIRPGNTVAPIEITLRNDMGQIDCTVNSPIPAMATNGVFFGSGSASPAIYAIRTGARVSRLSHPNALTTGTIPFPISPPEHITLSLWKTIAIWNCSTTRNWPASRQREKR